MDILQETEAVPAAPVLVTVKTNKPQTENRILNKHKNRSLKCNINNKYQLFNQIKENEHSPRVKSHQARHNHN